MQLKMKVKELIKQEMDVDVYDDYNEELGIAFCGPCKLTAQGKDRFAWVLEQEIDMFDDAHGILTGIVHAENEEEVLKYCEFFEAAAGYCGEYAYGLYFDEEVGYDYKGDKGSVRAVSG